MNTKSIWTLEWSKSQGCFHIDTLDRSMRRNTDAFMDNRQCDYVILAVASSQDEAHKIANEMEKLKVA